MPYESTMLRFRDTGKYLFFLLFVVLVGCQSNGSKIPEGFEAKPIPFLQRSAHIPINYEKINLNELGEMIRQNPEIDPTVEVYYNMALQIYSVDKVAPVLYAKEGDLNECIWFMPVPYTPLTDEVVAMYQEAIHNSMARSSDINGFQYEELEASFQELYSGGSITLKYLQTFEGNQKYLTQYVTTKNLETYIMMAYSSENKDFEVTFKSL